MLSLPPPASHLTDVTQRQVAEAWLADEQRKRSSTTFDVEASDERDAVEAKLLAHKPGSARGLLESNLSWSHCRLSERALRAVHADWGPPDERPTVESIARRIKAGDQTPRVCNDAPSRNSPTTNPTTGGRSSSSTTAHPGSPAAPSSSTATTAPSQPSYGPRTVTRTNPGTPTSATAGQQQ